MLGRFWARGNNYQATRLATDRLFKNFLHLGLQKPQKWKALYYVYSVLMNLYICVLVPLSFSLSYFFEHDKMTIAQLLTSLQVAINVWGLPAKIVTVALRFKCLRQAMNVMDILDARCHREEEREKIRHCAMIGNGITLFFISLYLFYAGITMITSLYMGLPPYSLFMPPMNWRNSKLEFGTQSFIEYMTMNLVCMHQAGNDVYTVIYIYVIRTHMQILTERVRRLGTDLSASNDEHYEQLVMCVKDHQDLLRLVDIISPVISITIFIQFMITAVILGTTMINIFIFADTSAQIASIVYFLAVLFQTCPCCYQATCLMEDSEQLTLAIFHCEWINKDIRFRKLMIFFMMRSQMPITLTAMKLFPITLNTSLGIAKFSFSLYTLIKEMDFGQNSKN